MGFEEDFCHSWQACEMPGGEEIQQRAKMADYLGIPKEVQEKMAAELSKGPSAHPITRIKKSVSKPGSYFIILRQGDSYRHTIEFKLDGSKVTNKRPDGQEAEAESTYDEAKKSFCSTLTFIGKDIPPMKIHRKLEGDKVHVEDVCGDITVKNTLAKVDHVADPADEAL